MLEMAPPRIVATGRRKTLEMKLDSVMKEENAINAFLGNFGCPFWSFLTRFGTEFSKLDRFTVSKR